MLKRELLKERLEAKFEIKLSIALPNSFLAALERNLVTPKVRPTVHGRSINLAEIVQQDLRNFKSSSHSKPGRKAYLDQLGSFKIMNTLMKETEQISSCNSIKCKPPVHRTKAHSIKSLRKFYSHTGKNLSQLTMRSPNRQRI
jgi:hypothetical protein